MIEKLSKTIWVRIRNEIRKRPLLAYKLGISLEKLEDYMNGVYPSDEEVKRFDEVLIKDREEKCTRIRNELSKIVGYRESVQFAEKIDVSDTSVRHMLENKGPLSGYDIILKFEIFLHHFNNFKISIENISLAEELIEKRLDEISNEVFSIGKRLTENSYRYKGLEKFVKKDNKQSKISDHQKYEILGTERFLEGTIRDLNTILIRVKAVNDTYLEI